MIEIGAITLYREKSTVHRFSSGSGDQNGEPALMIRSNRVVIPIKTRVENITAVVRGQNVPSTLRMTALVIDEFRRDEGPCCTTLPRTIGKPFGHAKFQTMKATTTPTTGCRCTWAGKAFLPRAKAKT